MENESTKRVMESLNFQGPDRIPMFDSFWDEFTEKWRKEKSAGKEADICDFYGIDLVFPVPDETFFPTAKAVIGQEGSYLICRDGWGRTVKMRENASFSQTIDTVLRNRNDLDNLSFDPPDLDIRYESFVKTVEKEKKKRCVFSCVGGPFARSSFIRGEADFLIDLAGDIGFAGELVDMVTEHLIAVGLESLRRGNLHDTGIWISDDMGFNDAPMFSPKIFEKIFLPPYKKIVSSFKKAGAKKVILHCDGNVNSLLDMLIEAGIDGINPVEPKAGMDILKLREKYNNKLFYIGGVDNAAVLPSGDKEKIKSHILPIIEAGKNGGIIIGTHSVSPDISVETYDYYYSVVQKYGHYKKG
ncbi:MAG: hypothetical protein JW957_05920 [Candidatus Omnitrophica bacterium]|nr:hypothetical protein [Candidatus Omnitrophota bacterium]